jgi:hypothetical protein
VLSVLALLFGLLLIQDENTITIIYLGNGMIKNFIYLDEEKMYSLSSQIFEGVTEYVLNEKSSESENSESQKGAVGSGNILGDILRQVDKKIEKRVFSDFSYTLFEKELLGKRYVIEANESFSIEGVTKQNLNLLLR